MTRRLRLAQIVALGGCVFYAIATLATIGSALATIELARVAARARNIAVQVEASIRADPTAPLERVLSAASQGDVSVSGLASLARRLHSAVDSASLAREDRPLVLGRGTHHVVTQPIKDADDWEIIGAVALPVAPFAGLVRPMIGVVAATVIAGVAMTLALGRLADGAAARGRGWLGLATITGSALTVWLAMTVSHALDGAALALGRQGPSSVIGDPSALPLASAAAVSVVLVLALASTISLWLAASWIASARQRAPDVRQTVAAWTFLAPSFVHVLLFSLGPLAFTFWVSLHRWDLLAADKPFVGFANYREMFGDPLFWQALRNTAVYALNVPVTMALALGAALLLQRQQRSVKILRTIVFLPYVVSYVAIAMVWQWILNYDFGLLNYLLRLVHLPPVDWLGDPRTALPAVMLVAVWVQLGFHMVVYLAGLQGIPEHLQEAARLDGATRWQRFRWVTFPLLRPVSVYLFVTGIIWSFQVFTLVYVMTEGGPVHATDVLVYQIYQNAWEFRRMGYASAMSWVLFAILLVVTIAQWKVIGRKADV